MFMCSSCFIPCVFHCWGHQLPLCWDLVLNNYQSMVIRAQPKTVTPTPHTYFLPLYILWVMCKTTSQPFLTWPRPGSLWCIHPSALPPVHSRGPTHTSLSAQASSSAPRPSATGKVPSLCCVCAPPRLHCSPVGVWQSARLQLLKPLHITFSGLSRERFETPG